MSTGNSLNKWLVDSAASYHVTPSLKQVSIHDSYEGNDELFVGDGTGLPFTHVGSTTVNSENHSFHLKNVLCVPKANKNLIYANQFCKDNLTFVELFPYSFLVKDLLMRKPLIQGPSKE